MSDSLRPHESQHARPPCPSSTPEVHPNPCPLSQWYHPTISSSVVPSPPALNLSQPQGLSKWVSSSHQVAKILEFQLQYQSFKMNTTQDWSPLGCTGWISLQSRGVSRVFSNMTVQKYQFWYFWKLSSKALSFLYSPTLFSPTLYLTYMTNG